MVYYKKMLRRMIGPKRKEFSGAWKGLHNEELRKYYASLKLISLTKPRMETLVGNVSRMVNMRNSYKIFVGKIGMKRSLGSFRRRWENIRKVLREILWGDMD
jgi:hypothetical protein